MTIQQERITDREVYEAPEVEVIEMKSEGIICNSGNTEPYTPGHSYDI